MELITQPSTLRGKIMIPGSKSHTIRALIIATLAEGTSLIKYPLHSQDTLSCLQACEAFGATIEQQDDFWQVIGTAGQPKLPTNTIDVGNSGTSMNFLIGLAALIDGYTILTGDDQIRRRPVQPLLAALTQLGLSAHSAPQTGCPPVIIRGQLHGGYTEVKGQISQYLSSLLLNCPLARGDTEIKAIDLSEKPYVSLTLKWLDEQNIHYEHEGLEHFWVKGGQTYRGFNRPIPADFSSATFFFGAAALLACDILLTGLDFNDPQGDKQVVDVLQEMGANIHQTAAGIHIRGGALRGIELDLGDMPDALPMLAVVGCFAQGQTTIRNVAHARLKETDRITVMCQELGKMGAKITELEDGLVIEASQLQGTTVNSHHDHRIAMALAMAGLAARGQTCVQHADAVQITFPQFPKLLTQLNASVRVNE